MQKGNRGVAVVAYLVQQAGLADPAPTQNRISAEPAPTPVRIETQTKRQIARLVRPPVETPMNHGPVPTPARPDLTGPGG